MANNRVLVKSTAFLYVLWIFLQYLNVNLLESVSTDKNNATKSTVSELQLCPSFPPTLRGYSRAVVSSLVSLDQFSRVHPEISLGGQYRPLKCRSKDKVAILLPFRDRQEHLRILLFNLHPLLQRQQLEYTVFVVEEGSRSKTKLFNKGRLFNAAFMEMSKMAEFDCVIFHDVDLIPENDLNIYNCPLQPRHMSVAIDKFNYTLPYRSMFGGVTAMRKEHFLQVNGYSNEYFGWGGEDDDMANRIVFNHLRITRTSGDVTRYCMLKHKQQQQNDNRFKLFREGKQRHKIDGLNNLNYTVEKISLRKLYTLIQVQI